MWSRVVGLCSIVVLGGAVVAAAQPSFRTAPTEEIVGGAVGKAVGDVDGDGKLDLAFATGQNGTIAVVYGFGDGFFESQLDYLAGTEESGVQPAAIAITNVNNDDFPDLVAVDASTGEASVLIGTGNREFNSDRIIFPAGVGGPVALVAAKLDSDDFVDLAIVGGDTQGAVSVLFGNGDGSFVSVTEDPYEVGAVPRDVAAGLIDGDEFLDLVVSNRDSGAVSVLRNAGTRAFQDAVESPSGDAPLGIALGDWNNDTFTDVVVANRNTDSFSFLAGNGTTSLAAPATFSTGLFPEDVGTGDFNDDGLPDVAIANYLSQDVSVAFGNGHGDFPTQRRFLSDAGTSGVMVGRFNDDMLPDLATFNTLEGSSYAVLLNRPEGGFQAGETFPALSEPSALAMADISGDGLPDVVVGGMTGGGAVLLVSRTGGGFSIEPLNTGAATTGASLVDVNDDLWPDLLLAQGNAVRVGLANGAGGFAPLQTLQVGRPIASVNAADLDRDGHADILVAESEAGSVGIFAGQAGGTFAAVRHVSVRPGAADAYPIGVRIRDVDGDGILDVLTPNFQDAGFVSLLFGTGGANFDTPLALTAPRRPLDVAVADVNGDGLLDVLSANEDNPGGVLVYKGSGSRNFAIPAPSSARFSMGSVPAALTMRDVTGDGVLDLLAADRVNDRVVIRAGRNNNSLFGGIESSCPNFGCLPAGRTPIRIASGDFDGDGRYDVLTLNVGGANLALTSGTNEVDYVRGDANSDGRISAADIGAVMRGLAAGADHITVEESIRSEFVTTLAADADGDGLMTPTDSLGVVGRIFPG